MPLPTADGGYLRDLLDKPFTDEQLAAATAPLTPQLVVAGAGSGKTTVMAARVVHAVAFHDVSPSAILGLTFTNKAAGQLAESVRKALRRLNASTLVDETPTVATYHSYAAGIVRDHALRIGREPVTTLLTEAGRWQLAMRVVRKASGPFRHIGWQPATVAAYLIALDGEMAEHLATVDDVRAFDAAFVAQVDALPSSTKALRDCADSARARDELLGLVETYRAEKQRLELIDYGDQVALAALIARESDEVCAIERERFRLVLLDEYQDTGIAQRLLLARLFGDGHAVTAVGDPNQGIYGWRGASVGNLLRFREQFGGADDVRPLMTSFRCGGRILAAANAIAAPLTKSPGAQRRPVVEVPQLSAAEGRESDGEIVVALLDRVDNEAEWIADEVERAVFVDGMAPGKVAVLCRRRTDFPLLHRALVRRDIPVEVVGLGGLLEMPEVADLVAVLRVLVEPTANPALLRILTGPRWRIGPRDLAALGRRAAALASTRDAAAKPADDDVDAALRKATEGVDAVDVASLLDVIDLVKPTDTDVSTEALSRLLELRAELDLLRALVGQPIVEVAAEVVRRIGLDVELETETSRVAAARIANLAAFLDHAAQFAGIEGESDLSSFLGWLDAAVAAESGLDVGGVSETDTAKLLTVHKAKGLEWDVVAIPGLTATVFPSSRPRSRWTSNAQVLPYAIRGDADDLPPPPALSTKGLDEFKAACTSDDADEERRLGYVAVTRAARRVLASGYWWGATRQRPMGPSELLVQLRELADTGLGDVATWLEEVDDESNPMAELTADDVAWPPSYDVDALGRRLRAADLVRGAMAWRPSIAGTTRPVCSSTSSDGNGLPPVTSRCRGASPRARLWCSRTTRTSWRRCSPDRCRSGHNRRHVAARNSTSGSKISTAPSRCSNRTTCRVPVTRTCRMPISRHSRSASWPTGGASVGRLRSSRRLSSSSEDGWCVVGSTRSTRATAVGSTSSTTRPAPSRRISRQRRCSCRSTGWPGRISPASTRPTLTPASSTSARGRSSVHTGCCRATSWPRCSPTAVDVTERTTFADRTTSYRSCSMTRSPAPPSWARPRS
jgi:DNA helicase-2/ATP-dependent DNA helicase PcrA